MSTARAAPVLLIGHFCDLQALPNFSTCFRSHMLTEFLSMPNELVKEQAMRLARERVLVQSSPQQEPIGAWSDLFLSPVLIREVHAEISKAGPIEAQRFYREFLRPFQ